MGEKNASNEQDVERTDKEPLEDQMNPNRWNQPNNWLNHQNQISNSPEDQWNNFMFGPRRTPQQDLEQQNQSSNQIDFVELMYNIDTLMESVTNLKPLFEKFYPYLQQFWKKK